MNEKDSYGAEQAILGNLLIAPDDSKIALDSLDESDFVDPRHRVIFGVLKKLYLEYVDGGSKGSFSLDVIIVQERLKADKAVSRAGGYSYLNELSSLAVSNDQVEEYVKLLQDNSLVRQFFEVLAKLKRQYEQEPIDYSVFLGQAEDEILNITRKRHVSDFVNIKDAIDRTMAFYGKSNTSFSSGFEQLDRLIEGFQPGNLTILAARPSVGKTALGLNFAFRVARAHKAVGIFSLEMSTEQIISRLLTDVSMLSSKRIKRCLAPQERSSADLAADRLAVKEGCQLLEKCQIFIDDSSSNRLQDIQAKARKLKASCSNLGLIVVDYIGLITSPTRGNNNNRQQEVADISRGLKALARDLQVPVLALSQLSRQIDTRPKHTPVLSDLRESGAIEQDADQVFFLSRDDYYKDKEGEAPSEEEPSEALSFDDEDATSKVSLIIAKNRNGPLGTIEFQFNKSHCHFEIDDAYLNSISHEDN